MNQQNIKSVLVEERRFPPSAEFTARARLKAEDLAALRAEAAANYKGFWARQAQDELRWHKPFSVTLDESKAPELPLVRRWRAQRFLQLPRRAPRGARPQDRR